MTRLGNMTLLALLTVVAAGPGCPDEGRDEDRDVAQLQAKEKAIDALIGDAPCKGGEDCRTIAFGAKPCGGPWQYKIFNAAEVDTVELKRLVKDYDEFNAVLNDRWGWMSDCAYVTPPEVGCVEGRCQAVTP